MFFVFWVELVNSCEKSIMSKNLSKDLSSIFASGYFARIYFFTLFLFVMVSSLAIYSNSLFLLILPEEGFFKFKISFNNKLVLLKFSSLVNVWMFSTIKSPEHFCLNQRVRLFSKFYDTNPVISRNRFWFSFLWMKTEISADDISMTREPASKWKWRQSNNQSGIRSNGYRHY